MSAEDETAASEAPAEPRLYYSERRLRSLAVNAAGPDAELVRMLDEVLAHRHWLAALGERLGRMARRLLAENEAWMNGVADVVEPLGFDREAACGPADLLPGLRSLQAEVELLREALAEAVPVLDYVSRGRGYVDVTKYPDATARMALPLVRDALDLGEAPDGG